ncbi:hypothetical protein CAPTEDRAFT_220855 [Capitella teleta]|uniref:Uncharacterized protein n=1 Tax=Capitella teleta TaxID=283909 RepID=R7V0P4_CAPTE|nr:hypothetical protein CAPTEDRAFT_220855 [Capitella teleta]|eukprot:ELU09782.1 hypothetical protein CAPTEDRAFT_220855 [Capitella teleta]
MLLDFLLQEPTSLAGYSRALALSPRRRKRVIITVVLLTFAFFLIFSSEPAEPEPQGKRKTSGLQSHKKPFFEFEPEEIDTLGAGPQSVIIIRLTTFFAMFSILTREYVLPPGPPPRDTRSLSQDAQACVNRFQLNLDELYNNYTVYPPSYTLNDANQSTSDICSLIAKEAAYNRSVFPDVFGSRSLFQPNGSRVTLVTQVSFNRLFNLTTQAKHWPGPMSVAMYLPLFRLETFVMDYCEAESLNKRENIQIHIMLDEGCYFFPTNVMRNLAMEYVYTSHSFITDGDHIPNPNMENNIIKHAEDGYLKGATVMIIPAFEYTVMPEGFTMVHDKEELMKHWDEKYLKPFYIDRFLPAYGPTNYTYWRTAEHPYTIEYGDQFEPYIVAETKLTHSYNNSFIGRFYNKAEHIAEFFARRFKFIVCNDCYEYHIPHTSVAGEHHVLYHHCMKNLYFDLREYLQKKYENRMPPPVKKW